MVFWLSIFFSERLSLFHNMQTALKKLIHSEKKMLQAVSSAIKATTILFRNPAENCRSMQKARIKKWMPSRNLSLLL